MDLDTLLHETARVPDPTPQALASGRAALDAAVATTARMADRARVARDRRARSRRSRRIGLIALIAAAASLAVVVAPSLNLGTHRPRASAEAAQLLIRAGAAAGAQPGGWPDARYWHAVSVYQQGSGPVHRREIWVGHNGPGLLRDDGLPGPIRLLQGEFSAGAETLTWDQLYALPTEPGALERTLRAGIKGAGPDDDTELFTIVGDLLRESPAPPALRKALWEVAARVPGVRLVGPVTDSIGRPGVAVERGYQRYVLDPSTGRLLEESTTLGAESYRSTYLEQGPADSAPG